MALNDSKKMSQYDTNAYTGIYNHTTDTFKYVFITETYSAIDENATSIGIANFTKVASSGNYVQDADLQNVTWTRAGSVTSLNFDNVSFAGDPANPTTAKTLAIYNDTSPNKDVFKLVDMTVDNGVTPADTTLFFNWTVNAGGSGTTNTNP